MQAVDYIVAPSTGTASAGGAARPVALDRREQERKQLRRLAEVRFGAPTAERLSALLRREDDLRRLDALAEAVVRCETADELLRQAAPELLRQAAPDGSAATPNA